MYQTDSPPLVKSLYAIWIINWLLIIGFVISSWVAASSKVVGSAQAFILIWITLMFIIPNLLSIILMHDFEWRTEFASGTYFGLTLTLCSVALMETVFTAAIAQTSVLDSGPFLAVCIFSALLTASTLLLSTTLYAAHSDFAIEYQQKAGEGKGSIKPGSETSGRLETGIGGSVPPPFRSERSRVVGASDI